MELQALAEVIGEKLVIRQWDLVTAESCTGGWIAQAVTSVAGSSRWFERGFVTYSNRSKQDMLGVAAESLARHGAVSEQVVKEMAEGALRQSLGQISVAVSGIAGPGGGTPDKPVGTVWLAWAVSDKPTRTQVFLIDGDRSAVRQRAAVLALQGVIEVLASDG